MLELCMFLATVALWEMLVGHQNGKNYKVRAVNVEVIHSQM